MEGDGSVLQWVLWQMLGHCEASQSTWTACNVKRIPDSSRLTTQAALISIIIIGETCK